MAETKDKRSDFDSLETKGAREMADHGMHSPEHLHWPSTTADDAALVDEAARARHAANHAAQAANRAGDRADHDAWEGVAETIDAGTAQPRASQR